MRCFFLGLDAFDVLFQGEADEELKIEGVSARENLSVRDRMAVDNVDFVFDDLDLSLEDLALEDNYLSHTDWFTLKKNNVPSEQHALAERVRNGEQGLECNEYELVYLSAEDRVVPVKSQGGYFQEIDWVTGEKVRQKPFIFRDSESKKYYAMRLKGGNPDTLELEETALKQRETIKKTESILAKAKDHTIYDFATRYQECFSTLETPGISAFNFFEFYKIIYKTSPTFRRIFNRYYEAYSLRPDKKNWEIAIYQNAVTRTDFTEYKIHIASDIEILQMHYVGNTIHEASRPEQIYLHEMLHALTGERDPIRAVSIRHRGPIVYLTDKILSEAGYVFPQRIMYRRLSDVLEISGGEIERKQLRQFMKTAKALVSQENSYLDRIVDKDISVFIERKVFGEEIAERYTVKESELIWSKIKNVWVERDSYIFGKRFERLFSAVDEDTLQGLQAFYANFYEKSTLFAKLFDNWAFTVDRSVQRWRFEIDNPDILSELPANKQVHCINDLTKKIYIFDDKTLYLSDKGLIPVERARQLLHEMVQILTEFKDIPAGIALRNRGAVVQLCDEIFAEMELNLPKRLVSALVRPDDIEKQTVLLSYQLEASRAVRLENKFIEQRRLPPASSHCPPICRSKRSSENSPRLNTRLFLKDKQENIFLIKQTIKNNLKKHKLTQAVQHNAAEAFFLTKTSRLTFLENETFTLNENSTVKNDTFFIAKSLSLN